MAAQQRERVVVALGRRTGIGGDLFGCRHCGGARTRVPGVGHAWSGPLAQHRIQGRAGLRVEPAADRGHTVGALSADGDAAFAGAIGIVGCRAVLIEQVAQQFCCLTQFFRALPARAGDQGLFALHPGGFVDPSGQVREEVAEDLDVLGIDGAVGLGSGQMFPPWRQGLSGQGGSWAQRFGVTHAATGLTSADA